MSLNFKIFGFAVLLGLSACSNKPMESFAVATDQYSVQVALFEDSTFMMQVTEGDSNYSLLGNWRKTKAEDSLTLNIMRKDLNTLNAEASMHFTYYVDHWKPVDGLQHVSALRDRTIYDKD